METKVNLRGMINLNSVEDLLSEVLSRMDAQEKSITAIQSTMQGLMPRQTAERCIDELHDAVKVLSGRVDAVREASVARVDNKLCSAGELSSQNKIKLDTIFVSLSEITAKARGLEADVKGTLGEHAEALETLNGDYTPINMTRALQTGLKECGGRIDLCEVAITKKVDKSFLGHIESLVVDLEKYSEHRVTAEKKLAKLEAQTATLLNGLNEQAKMLEQNTANDELFSKETTTVHHEFKERMDIMQKMLQTHDRTIGNDCVRMASFSELLKWSENANSLLTQFDDKHKSLKCELSEMSSVVDTKADNDEVTKYYVRRDKLCAIIESMGKDIENRAKQTELQGTQETLQSLKEFADQQHSQLQIALRFVDWFTQRGDTYESNMQVIDKHLKQLATSSVGGVTGHAPPGTGLDKSVRGGNTMSQHNVRYYSVHQPQSDLDST